jgi:hypothetical protein
MKADTFSRIGLAILALTDNSTINGPARDELKRLATELEEMENDMVTIINDRVRASVEGLEGRVMSAVQLYMEQQFEGLAAKLEELDLIPAGAIAPPTPAEPTPAAEPPAGESTSAPPVSESASPSGDTTSTPAEGSPPPAPETPPEATTPAETPREPTAEEIATPPPGQPVEEPVPPSEPPADVVTPPVNEESAAIEAELAAGAASESGPAFTGTDTMPSTSDDTQASSSEGSETAAEPEVTIGGSAGEDVVG